MDSQAPNNPDNNQELDRKAYNLFVLYHASRTLSSVMDVQELSKLSLDMTGEVVRTKWGLFYLMNEGQEHLSLRAVKGVDAKQVPEHLELGDGFVEWTTGKTETKSFQELRQSLLWTHAFPKINDLAFLKPAFVVPIFHKIQFVGLLILGEKSDEGAFSENDLELLSTIASLSANAIVNAHLYELAILDGATQLFVVRYFKQRMVEEMKRATRYTQPLAFIMLDIDYFKNVNDAYGHLVGDKVLIKVADIIRECTREFIDLPCRYGGEEFAILLPETDSFGAYHVAERIREGVQNASFLDAKLKLTISGGIACYPADATEPEALIEKADLALYEAKRSGRNIIMAYNQAAMKGKKG